MGSGDTSSSSDFFCRRHVFLCYKNPAVWPPRIEAAEFDRLPRLLHAAINARKPHIKKETCLTICEGHDGTETSNGDVLIFPDMIRYRRLTHFDVETFVEEVLVKEGEWLPGNPESLKASYVFVCSHGSRDRRCGVFGPILVSRFREEIELHGLQGKVLISSCSHIGGNKYAGNVIIFGSSINREVTGHLYGYVTPDDVPLLFHQHIIKGEIFDSLWRGQIGLSEDEQKKKQEQRLQLNGGRNLGGMVAGRCQTDGESCCQDNEDSCCCQNDVFEEMTELSTDNKRENVNVISRINKGKGALRKFSSMPTWLDSWEQEDTYAALAVVCAAVSVAIAYSCYKQLR
ncbi:hypothetical protein GLYMA_08G331100v4 [Glycine max]|uniref:Altered inheritance of mitochondria protein 32 n=3 Tax=Glycine subgen. Soja TaxID=1462606 RepID=A0A0R0IZG4_SOYBN|nr:hypothetical protein GLYMA_08G331100v4 [Glycine max]